MVHASSPHHSPARKHSFAHPPLRRASHANSLPPLRPQSRSLIASFLRLYSPRHLLCATHSDALAPAYHSSHSQGRPFVLPHRHKYTLPCLVTCGPRYGYTPARTRANTRIRTFIVTRANRDALTCSRNPEPTHVVRYVHWNTHRYLRSCTRAHALQHLHQRVATYGLSYLAIHDRVHAHSVAR
jgi:hypothetical protein